MLTGGTNLPYTACFRTAETFRLANPLPSFYLPAMKFLHTADWQIGMKAAHVGAAGGRVREERLNAARRVIEEAQRHGAEFVLVAGDTFEDNGVDRVLVQRVADILTSFNGPVYVIPGNHDPLTPGSVWEHPVWKSTGSVTVLREETPVKIPGGTLFPCPAREKRSGRNPTAWIDARSAEGIRIGLAHGTVEGVVQEELDYPIPRDAADRAGLDYLALGHWHSFLPFPSPDGAARMAYSGTHETTKFGERDSGNALLVEIAKPGAPPVITTIHTGSLEWKSLEKDLREAGDLSRLRADIETIANAGEMLLDVRLAGVLAANDSREIERLREVAESRFLYFRLDYGNVRPLPGDDGWLERLPVGIVREAAAKLCDWSNPAWAGARPEGASPEVAARALMELYALLGEESR